MQPPALKECPVRVIVFIRENTRIAWLAARVLRARQVAIVIGNTIHLFRSNREEFLANRDWVCHELMHIRQFKKYGMARFCLLYLAESIRSGYYHNRFEIEAREAERDPSLLTGVQFH